MNRLVQYLNSNHHLHCLGWKPLTVSVPPRVYRVKTGSLCLEFDKSLLKRKNHVYNQISTRPTKTCFWKDVERIDLKGLGQWNPRWLKERILFYFSLVWWHNNHCRLLLTPNSFICEQFYFKQFSLAQLHSLVLFDA